MKCALWSRALIKYRWIARSMVSKEPYFVLCEISFCFLHHHGR